MITRAKAGIFKPKIFNTQKTLSLETRSSVVETLNDQNWKQAMQEEFNALIRNQTWCLVSPNTEFEIFG